MNGNWVPFCLRRCESFYFRSLALCHPQQWDKDGSSVRKEMSFLHLSHYIDTEVMTEGEERLGLWAHRFSGQNTAAIWARAYLVLWRTRLNSTDMGVYKNSSTLFHFFPHFILGKTLLASQSGERSWGMCRNAVQNLTLHLGGWLRWVSVVKVHNPHLWREMQTTVAAASQVGISISI